MGGRKDGCEGKNEKSVQMRQSRVIICVAVGDGFQAARSRPTARCRIGTRAVIFRGGRRPKPDHVDLLHPMRTILGSAPGLDWLSRGRDQ